jgi:prepilin-type N-terminal cleavage/methylation domain-containing protein
MRRKGFTLVELLVVIGIIAVLMGILLPVLNAVRRGAQKVICGTNLSGIGKAILLYANDYEGDYPRGGGPKSEWGDAGQIEDWDNLIGNQYGDGEVTITCSLYLLVKYADVTPSQFVCSGDVGTEKFKLSEAPGLNPDDIDDITDVWDFGSQTGGAPTNLWPGQYNSYAYHSPYQDPTTEKSFPLGSYSSPSSPLCADRNPYLDKNSVAWLEGSDCSDSDESRPKWRSNAYTDPDKTGNSAAHQREGQNVLFCDSHVDFEKYPNVGVSKDNIWKCWEDPDNPPNTPKDREIGETDPYCDALKDDGEGAPAAERDAYLVSEYNADPGRT